MPSERPETGSYPAWEPSGDPSRVVEEGHRKVIQHYKELLQTQTAAPPGEREAWERGIAREETALREITHAPEEAAA
jgi:hypothetical protein